MATLSVAVTGSVDSNSFSHTFNFKLGDLETDAVGQVLVAEGGTKSDSGVTLSITRSQDVPISIPVDLPLGIKTVLHEAVSLAESVIFTLLCVVVA